MTAVASPLAPWTKAMLDMLADGAWHSREAVILAGCRAVPPGRAFRAGEYHRNRPDKRPSGPGPRVKGSRDDSIRNGARALARQSLNHLTRRGHVARRGDSVRVKGRRR